MTRVGARLQQHICHSNLESTDIHCIISHDKGDTQRTDLELVYLKPLILSSHVSSDRYTMLQSAAKMHHVTMAIKCACAQLNVHCKAIPLCYLSELFANVLFALVHD